MPALNGSRHRLVLGCVIVFLALPCLLCSRCLLLWQDAPPRQLSTADLLLKADDLPGTWVVAEGPERAWTEISVPDSQGVIFETSGNLSPRKSSSFVYKYRSESEAIWLYFWFVGPSQFGETPPHWEYTSPIADQSSLTCYQYPQVEFASCSWAARYSEYIVEFFAPLGDDRMSLEDMERVVRTIDARMARNLGRTIGAP